MDTIEKSPDPTTKKSSNASPPRRGAQLVAAGILLSRIAGLVRERAFAHYFGNSDAGDAFKAALKIPNFLQNLFGEGVLSASFIPVYARLIAHGDEEEARKVAGSIFSLLALATSVLIAAGVFATPLMIDLIAPGFHGEKRLETIKLVQIFFPGTGLLVLSAWCLGILNSHRKFFLSYAAPVLWNCAIIAALVLFGQKYSEFRLAELVAWGLVVGSALQFGAQFPVALKLIKGLAPRPALKLASVRTVIRNFFPVVLARGVVQISAYIDNVLASLLPTGAVSALAYAQTIYLLPVSLFGMSVSAAQLPAMSSAKGDSEEIARELRAQLERGLRQIAFFIIPSVAGFLFLGDIIVSALFQSGAFDHESTVYVWGVLAGSTVGLLATTLGRLYSSAFYALRDTRTPLKCAAVRVLLTTGLGWVCALKATAWLGLDSRWGTAGLTASAGASGWVEFLSLRFSLNKRIGHTGLAKSFLARLWIAALTGAIGGWTMKLVIGGTLHPAIRAAFVFSTFGTLYAAVTLLLKVEEARSILEKIGRRLRRK